MEETELLVVLRAAAGAVRRALDGIEDSRALGNRPGQYHLDLEADAAALAVLHAADLEVLSEESGVTRPPGTTSGGNRLLAVLDPVDGSTNASLGLPWFATSICLMDDQGPLLGVVVNQATGAEYRAWRGGGAFLDDEPIHPSGRTLLKDSVIGVSGLAKRWPGWAQFRALGAASLDLCAVAAGNLDGYLPVGGSGLHVWDYLAALLVCSEAGALVGERSSRQLDLRDDSLRRPVAAASSPLLGELLALDV